MRSFFKDLIRDRLKLFYSLTEINDPLEHRQTSWYLIYRPTPGDNTCKRERKRRKERREKQTKEEKKGESKNDRQKAQLCTQ